MTFVSTIIMINITVLGTTGVVVITTPRTTTITTIYDRRGKFGVVVRATWRTRITTRHTHHDNNNNNADRVVALKRVRKGGTNKSTDWPSSSYLRQEVEIQASLSHPNIAKLFGYFHTSDHVVLVMEWVQSGDLRQYLLRQQQQQQRGTNRLVTTAAAAAACSKGRRGCTTSPPFLLPLYHVSHILHQVLQALAYLQERHVYHRDLKPENILYDESSCACPCGAGGAAAAAAAVATPGGVAGHCAYPHVRLCDFGVAVRVTPTTTSLYHHHDNNDDMSYYRYSLVGTMGFVAPEIVLAFHQKSAYQVQYVDSWSLGVVAYELVYGELPNSGSSSTSRDPSLTLSNLEDDSTTSTSSLTVALTPPVQDCDVFQASQDKQPQESTMVQEVRDFCQVLLNRVPHERPLAAELLEHAFVQHGRRHVCAGNKDDDHKENHKSRQVASSKPPLASNKRVVKRRRMGLQEV